MEEVFERLTEAIRQLQATQIANVRLLRAIIATHPDPGALREAWSRYSGSSVVDAQMKKAGEPERETIHDAVLDAVSAWSGRLEADLAKP